MLSLVCIVAIIGLAALAFTRHRIFLVCGFYSFYAFLTVLVPGTVPRVGPITIYRALYLVLLMSFLVRLVQDGSFLGQTRRWPLLPYSVFLVLILASSLYSQTSSTFFSPDGWSVWDSITMISLFWLAASQVQRESDLTIMAGTTVGVSLVLSVWVIWNAAQLNFEALRGGVDINQNYVSLFVLPGAVPLVSGILVSKRRLVKLLCVPPLLCVVAGGLILASRGMFIAFLLAVIWMTAVAFRGRRRSTLIKMYAALVLIFGVALLLPGTGGLLTRFQEADVGTLNDRTMVWQQAFVHFRESGLARMTFGQGLSSATFVLEPFVTTDLVNYHNQYLKYLMEQGFVGATAFLVFLYAMIRRVNRTRQSLRPTMVGWIGFLLITGLSATPADSHVFWIIFGVIASVCSLSDDPGFTVRSADEIQRQ